MVQVVNLDRYFSSAIIAKNAVLHVQQPTTFACCSKRFSETCQKMIWFNEKHFCYNYQNFASSEMVNSFYFWLLKAFFNFKPFFINLKNAWNLFTKATNKPNVPVFILSFYDGDQVNVFNEDEQLVGQIRACFIEIWPRGIERGSKVSDVVTFKFRGSTQSFVGELIVIISLKVCKSLLACT